MIVFALGLAVVGMILALQQARSFTIRVMSEVKSQAARTAMDARNRLDRELEAALFRVARRLSAGEHVRGVSLKEIPNWIDALYLWNGSKLLPLAVRGDTPERLTTLIEARLAVRSLAGLATLDRHTEILYDNLGDQPVVLACLDVSTTPGRVATIAAHFNLDRLRKDVVESMLPVGSGLEVRPQKAPPGIWSQSLSGPLRFWRIEPTRAFVRDQQSAVVRQTLVYLGLTTCALIALLGGMWFLIRVARREMALAELKANFVADVSHELKTPLALIRMFAETLQEGRVPTEEKRREYYGIILRESTRLTNLINNILDFARIEAGKKMFTFDTVDAGQVVRDTYTAYTAQLDAARFEHRLSIDPDLPPVRADRDAIAQAVLNLINNAVKYSPDERFLFIEVTADTRRGRHGVLISVHDRGIGISPEDRQRLTEGFFRASDGRVRSQSGAGLGLALVKHIVDEHDGTFDIESRLVKGSTFRIFLPAAQDGDGQNQTPADKNIPTPEAPKTSSHGSPVL